MSVSVCVFKSLGPVPGLRTNLQWQRTIRLFTVFTLFIYINFQIYICFGCFYVHHMHASYPQRLKEGVQVPGLGVMDSYELLNEVKRESNML